MHTSHKHALWDCNQRQLTCPFDHNFCFFLEFDTFDCLFYLPCRLNRLWSCFPASKLAILSAIIFCNVCRKPKNIVCRSTCITFSQFRRLFLVAKQSKYLPLCTLALKRYWHETRRTLRGRSSPFHSHFLTAPFVCWEGDGWSKTALV